MHNKISLTDYNLTKPNHRDRSILYHEHVLSTFCYSYPKCQSISMELYSHLNSEHWLNCEYFWYSLSSVSSLKIWAHRSSGSMSCLILQTSPQKQWTVEHGRTQTLHTSRPQQLTWSWWSPIARQCILPMLSSIQRKGLLHAASPFSASLNRLFRDYNSAPYSKSSSPPCRQPACTLSSSSNLDLNVRPKYKYCRMFTTALILNLDITQRLELRIFLLLGVSPCAELLQLLLDDLSPPYSP